MPTLDELLQGLPTGREALFAAILPFLLLALAAAWAGNRASTRSAAARACALALAVGYVSTHLVLWGLPPLPPIYASDWLLAVVVMATLATVWSVGPGRPDDPERRGFLPRAVHVTAAVAAVALIIRPRILAARWETLEAIQQTLVVGAPVLMAWLLGSHHARTRPAREASTLLMSTVGAASIAIGMAGSQKLAQAAGGVAAAATALWLVSLRQRDARGGASLGTATPAIALLGGLTMNATLYAELGRDLHGLLLLPFVIAPLSARLPGADREGWLPSVLRGLALSLPAIVAAGLAVSRFQVDDGAAGYY